MSKTKKDPKNETSKKESKKSLKGGPSESDETRLAREREMIDNLNRENIYKYFGGLEPSSTYNDLSVQAILGSLQQVTYGIQMGEVMVREEPLAVPQPVHLEVKLDYDEKRHLESKAYREEMQRRYDYLYEQIRPEGKEDYKQRKQKIEVKQILSKEQHERRMQNILAQKAELKKRIEEHQEQQNKKNKEQQEQKESIRKMQEEKAKEQKRLQIEQKMKKRKQEWGRALSQEKQLQKKYGMEKKKGRLYKQMEQRYRSELLLPLLQEKKMRLKELREFNKKYDLAAVRQHQKEYNHSLQKSRKSSEEKFHSERRRNPTGGEGSRLHVAGRYNPPAHSARIIQLFQEQQEILQKKVNYQKNRNQEKTRRQSQFTKEVKLKYRPKIDEIKRKQIENRMTAQPPRQQRSSVDQRKLGQDYLKIAKKMRRSQSVQSGLQAQKQQIGNDPVGPRQTGVNSLAYHSQQFYEQMRRKKIDAILNSEEGVSDKYIQMASEVEKLKEKMKQKEELALYNKDGQSQEEAAELLLESIHAKMGIVSLLKKNAVEGRKNSDD